jgi:hypothetical protein
MSYALKDINEFFLSCMIEHVCASAQTAVFVYDSDIQCGNQTIYENSLCAVDEIFFPLVAHGARALIPPSQ